MRGLLTLAQRDPGRDRQHDYIERGGAASVPGSTALTTSRWTRMMRRPTSQTVASGRWRDGG